MTIELVESMGAQAELWHIGVPNEDGPGLAKTPSKFIILRFDSPRKSRITPTGAKTSDRDRILGCHWQSV